MSEYVQKKSTLNRRDEPTRSSLRKPLKVLHGKLQNKRTLAPTSPLRHEWRREDVYYRLSEAKSYTGMPLDMKEGLRRAAASLSIIEGRRVSMSEVQRRLLDAAGITSAGSTPPPEKRTRRRS